MRFAHCFISDIRNGIVPVLPWVAAAFLLQILQAFAMQTNALAFHIDPSFSLGDHAAYSFAGTREHAPDEIQRMRFPTGWMLTLLLALYIPLSFPCRNLDGFGKLIVVASGNRWSWWLAKCCWVITCVLLFWLASLAGIIVGTLIQADTMQPNVNAGAYLLECNFAQALPLPWNIAPFMVSAMLMMMALCLAQLFLSFATRPIVAFLLVTALVFATVFASSPLLPAEYLMATRSACIIEQGASAPIGMIYALGISTLSIVGGGVLFSRKDITNKEMAQ